MIKKSEINLVQLSQAVLQSKSSDLETILVSSFLGTSLFGGLKNQKKIFIASTLSDNEEDTTKIFEMAKVWS